MYHNHVFDDVNEALPRLLHDLERKGEEVGSRAGRTKELTHIGITLTKPWRREIMLDHRKPSLAAQIAETIWVLAGHNDIGWLEHYLPRAKEFSDDGQTWRAGYGKRLRSWPVRNGDPEDVIDQLRWVVDLLQRDPASRQAVATIWDPKIDTQPGKDIPCNDWLSFSSRLGKLDLHVALRSNDIIWGWSGINQFEWSALLEIVAGLVGVQCGSLHFSTTSFHIYEHHWLKGHRIWESSVSAVPPLPADDSPRFDAATLPSRDIDGLDSLLTQWLVIEKMIRNGGDVLHLVESFPEPMLRSWLRILQWWWTGDREYLSPIEGTALERATLYSVQPPDRRPAHWSVLMEEQAEAEEQDDLDYDPTDFLSHLCRLHLEKEAAYGGSWKRRGEMLGIMANIARKVDRLGGGETADETSADTAGDLLVYLAKYHTWLHEHVVGGQDNAGLSDHAAYANATMMRLEAEDVLYDPARVNPDVLTEQLVKGFDTLELDVVAKRADRDELVYDMMRCAYVLARFLWEKERDAERARTEKRDRMLQQMGTREEDRGVDDYLGADHD